MRVHVLPRCTTMEMGDLVGREFPLCSRVQYVHGFAYYHTQHTPYDNPGTTPSHGTVARYTSVREKLDDPKYASWFIKFKGFNDTAYPGGVGKDTNGQSDNSVTPPSLPSICSRTLMNRFVRPCSIHQRPLDAAVCCPLLLLTLRAHLITPHVNTAF